MSGGITLVNLWASMFGARVRIALEEKGLSYEYIEEDIWNKSPLLLELNPVHKKVPVLVHDGKTICESMIIVQYIDDMWNDRAPLLPSDPYARAQARFWANFIDQKLYNTGCKMTWHKNKDELEEGKKELIEIFKVLEGALGDQTYFGGDAFGFADVALIGFGSMFYSYETCGNFSIEAECPKLIAWSKRCLARDAVSKSLPDQNKVYELVLNMRRKLGLENC